MGGRLHLRHLVPISALLQVLLLDEITVDLDVLGRSDLLSYLVEETEQRKSTIIYVMPLNFHIVSFFLLPSTIKEWDPHSSFTL